MRKSLLVKSSAIAIFAAALMLLLIITWLVYRPGLNGSFLFDDFANLTALGNTGPVHGWHMLLRYLTSGVADPAGRPLTMLSFLIDARNWPADPRSFKITNLLLHLLNGALLAGTMLALGRRINLDQRRNAIAAWLGTALWLLHPLFVSTTLYIVQREAMLPLSFTLCGLLCWCTGRDRLDAGRVGSAWRWMIAGAWVCTLFATLCKANGALLPLLIVAAECTVLRIPARAGMNADAINNLRRLRGILLGIPILLLAFALVAEVPSAIRAAAENRPWTIGQRLLSEPHILMDYLRLLWLPRATSYGLFNDQVRASADWLHPWTTLPSAIAILALIVLGWQLRRRKPILAFAILFYFAAQTMESSFLPLELAFEHRNYLPAAFMFWPLAFWLSDARSRPLRGTVAALIICTLAVLTWNRCRVWGDLRQQALIWGRINPASARAQAFAAAIDENYGHYPDAITRLRATATRMPDEVQITLNLVDAECATGAVDQMDWQRALYSLQHTVNGSLQVFNWFTKAIPLAQKKRCTGLTLSGLQQALNAAHSNQKFGKQSGRMQDYAHIAGLIALAQQQPEIALDDFNRALLDSPDRGTALAQAAALGAAGYPAYGLRHLDLARLHPDYVKHNFGMPRLHDWLLWHDGYWQHETARLRATLAADVAARRASTTPATPG